jgi:hypothetical protein
LSTHQEVAEHQAEPGAVFLGAGHLPVASVMAQEAELAAHDREKYRGHEVPPACANPPERHPAGCE